MDANKLPNPPIGISFIENGVVNQEWIAWFQRVYDAITRLQNAP